MTRIDCVSNDTGRNTLADGVFRGLLIPFILCCTIVAPVFSGEVPRRGGTLSLPLNGNPKMWPLVGSLPHIPVRDERHRLLDPNAGADDLAWSSAASRCPCPGTA